MACAYSPIFLLTLPAKDYGYISPNTKHTTMYCIHHKLHMPHIKHTGMNSHTHSIQYLICRTTYVPHINHTPHTPHTRHITESTQMTYTPLPCTEYTHHIPHTLHTLTLPVYLLGRFCYGLLMIWKCLQYSFYKKNLPFFPFPSPPSLFNFKSKSREPDLAFLLLWTLV